MKKKLGKVIFLVAMAAVVLGGAIQVSAKSVQIYQSYYQNKFTDAISNSKSTYGNVPQNYKIKYTTHDVYSGGWNFNIHEIFYHWTPNGQ